MSSPAEHEVASVAALLSTSYHGHQDESPVSDGSVCIRTGSAFKERRQSGANCIQLKSDLEQQLDAASSKPGAQADGTVSAREAGGGEAGDCAEAALQPAPEVGALPTQPAPEAGTLEAGLPEAGSPMAQTAPEADAPSVLPTPEAGAPGLAIAGPQSEALQLAAATDPGMLLSSCLDGYDNSGLSEIERMMDSAAALLLGLGQLPAPTPAPHASHPTSGSAPGTAEAAAQVSSERASPGDKRPACELGVALGQPAASKRLRKDEEGAQPLLAHMQLMMPIALPDDPMAPDYFYSDPASDDAAAATIAMLASAAADAAAEGGSGSRRAPRPARTERGRDRQRAAAVQRDQSRSPPPTGLPTFHVDGLKGGTTVPADFTRLAYEARLGKPRQLVERHITNGTYLNRVHVTQLMCALLFPRPPNPPASHKAAIGNTFVSIFKHQLTIIDEKDRAWPVQYEGFVSSGQRHYRLTSGWSSLMRSQDACIGDTLVLERWTEDRAMCHLFLLRQTPQPGSTQEALNTAALKLRQQRA